MDSNSEDELKVKEQAILELGSLLADTKQAEGTTKIRQPQENLEYYIHTVKV